MCSSDLSKKGYQKRRDDCSASYSVDSAYHTDNEAEEKKAGQRNVKGFIVKRKFQSPEVEMGDGGDAGRPFSCSGGRTASGHLLKSFVAFGIGVCR